VFICCILFKQFACSNGIFDIVLQFCAGADENRKICIFRLLRLRRLEWQCDGHLGEVSQVVSWVDEGGAAAAAAS